MSYLTADNLAVLPENSSESVAQLCAHLGFDPDMYFTLKPVSDGSEEFRHPYPTPCSVRDAVTRYLDINSVPALSLLESLMPYVADKSQKDLFLNHLSTPDSRDLLRKFLKGNGCSVSSLLSPDGLLSSCKVPLVDFLHIVPMQQPRYYTISSSSSANPLTVAITVRLSVTMVESATLEGSLPAGRSESGNKDRAVQGVCSSYLQRIAPGDRLRVFIRASSFRLPQSLSTPVIMIGPGTGIAPMRAMLQELSHQVGSRTEQLGPVTLYFGCQNRQQDYIYQSELESYQSSGVLGTLHLAFSREGAQKVYVQNLLAENGQVLCQEILDMGGYVFVCGATAMGADILETITNAFATHKGWTRDVAQQTVKSLQQKGRYVQELWTA